MRRVIGHHKVGLLRRIPNGLATAITPLLIGGVALWAQQSKPLHPPGTPMQQSSPPSSNPLPTVQLEGDATLHHLNRVSSSSPAKRAPSPTRSGFWG